MCPLEEGGAGPSGSVGVLVSRYGQSASMRASPFAIVSATRSLAAKKALAHIRRACRSLLSSLIVVPPSIVGVGTSPSGREGHRRDSPDGGRQGHGPLLGLEG